MPKIQSVHGVWAYTVNWAEWGGRHQFHSASSQLLCPAAAALHVACSSQRWRNSTGWGGGLHSKSNFH